MDKDRLLKASEPMKYNISDPKDLRKLKNVLNNVLKQWVFDDTYHYLNLNYDDGLYRESADCRVNVVRSKNLKRKILDSIIDFFKEYLDHNKLGNNDIEEIKTLLDYDQFLIFAKEKGLKHCLDLFNDFVINET